MLENVLLFIQNFFNWVFHNYKVDPEKSNGLQSFFSILDLCIEKFYPLSVKILLKFHEISDIQGVTRIDQPTEITEEDILRINHLKNLGEYALSMIEEVDPNKQKKRDKSTLL